MSDSSNPDRRSFLRSLTRLGLGGLLAGGVGWLSLRSGRACLRNFRCRDCPHLADCGEPQAMMMRKYGDKESPRANG
jgi:hypothetical protein